MHPLNGTSLRRCECCCCWQVLCSSRLGYSLSDQISKFFRRKQASTLLLKELNVFWKKYTFELYICEGYLLIKGERKIPV